MAYEENNYDFTPSYDEWEGAPEGTIARYTEVGHEPWDYFFPKAGWFTYSEEYDIPFYYNGTEWLPINSGEVPEDWATGTKVTIVGTGENLPASPEKGEIVIDMRYTVKWMRVYDGNTWELVGSGKDIMWNDNMTVDFERGTLTSGLVAESGKLKLGVN